MQKAITHVALRKRETYIGNVSDASSNGVMDECWGKVQEPSAHATSFIVMYLAVVEIHHCATAHNEKASALPNKEGKCHGTFIQWGDG